MDMWPPYIFSALRHVPGARDKIVFDPYHVMSYMNEAVDEVGVGDQGESLREFWKKPTREQAFAHWKLWYRWATQSRLKPVIKTAKNKQQKLHNVLTYFTHRITNAVAGGLNFKIQTVKKTAYGFRSFENFSAAIFFHCLGLRLYPVTHAKPG